jgi:hypothetical protein
LVSALLAHALGEIKRAAEHVAQRFVAFDPARDVARNAAEISPDAAQRLVRAIELFGVRVTLIGD